MFTQLMSYLLLILESLLRPLANKQNDAILTFTGRTSICIRPLEGHKGPYYHSCWTVPVDGLHVFNQA